jgi:hypothetical protein
MLVPSLYFFPQLPLHPPWQCPFFPEGAIEEPNGSSRNQSHQENIN